MLRSALVWLKSDSSSVEDSMMYCMSTYALSSVRTSQAHNPHSSAPLLHDAHTRTNIIIIQYIYLKSFWVLNLDGPVTKKSDCRSKNSKRFLSFFKRYKVINKLTWREIVMEMAAVEQQQRQNYLIIERQEALRIGEQKEADIGLM